MKLHIDIETFSTVDLKSAGAHKYCESLDFEVLILCYAFGDGPVETVDLAQGEPWPADFLAALVDPAVVKCAHNAAFERLCFRACGYDVPAVQWRCSAVRAAQLGYPLALADVSAAMELGDAGKLAAGRALIQLFSVAKKKRTRPADAPERWELYKRYCAQDVVAEREVTRRLSDTALPVRPGAVPDTEHAYYVLDQRINDRGVLVDTGFARAAVAADALSRKAVMGRLRDLTGLRNPNSPVQLRTWLAGRLDRDIPSLAEAEVSALLADPAVDGDAREVLELRQAGSKTSTKKYEAMLARAGFADDRARGLVQFMGAYRTGRWAGRGLQVQNLPRTYLADIDAARAAVLAGWAVTTDVLSQLIRTALVPRLGRRFAVADLAAIEARVIAWLAGEQWRLEVFRTHGKIYEASAAAMFGVTIEQVDKEMRAKGKVAELALGYQGGVGALKKMGGEAMGLDEDAMAEIVRLWRSKNKQVVRLWHELDASVRSALTTPGGGPDSLLARSGRPLATYYPRPGMLAIELPSGRRLYYQRPRLAPGRFGEAIQYRGEVTANAERGIAAAPWGWVETYGGKLVENMVQAVARDVLADSMLRIEAAGYEIVMHIHDEVVVEVPEATAEADLARICEIMSRPPSWAPDLPLAASGYVSSYYKKD